MLANPAVVGQSELTDISMTGYAHTSGIRRGFIRYNNYNGQSLNFSMALKNGKFGIGGNVIRDEIIYSKIAKFNGFFAYHKDFQFGKLSLGTSLGATNDAYDFSIFSSQSPPFNPTTGTDRYFNLGFGAMFSNKYGFISFSNPNVLDRARMIVSNGMNYTFELSPFTRAVISGGLRLPVFTEQLVFRPAFVYRAKFFNNDLVRLSEIHELELNASFQIFKSFWINTSFNPYLGPLLGISQGIDVGVGYQFKKGFRILLDYGMLSYDGRFNSNTLELILGQRLNRQKNDRPYSQATFF